MTLRACRKTRSLFSDGTPAFAQSSSNCKNSPNQLTKAECFLKTTSTSSIGRYLSQRSDKINAPRTILRRNCIVHTGLKTVIHHHDVIEVRQKFLDIQRVSTISRSVVRGMQQDTETNRTHPCRTSLAVIGNIGTHEPLKLVDVVQGRSQIVIHRDRQYVEEKEACAVMRR